MSAIGKADGGDRVGRIGWRALVGRDPQGFECGLYIGIFKPLRLVGDALVVKRDTRL